MTNNWSDLDHSTMFFVCGANPAENHPASIAHLNIARYDLNGRGRNAGLVVVDPRQTRTARLTGVPYDPANTNDLRKHDRYVRIRPGTNIAFINGVLHSIITWMYANKSASPAAPGYPNVADKFFQWHNSTAGASFSYGRQFTPDNGSTIKHTLTAAELAVPTDPANTARCQYSKDGGATWSDAPIASGWPKYCDSRVKVDPATGDYKRVLMRTATGVLFSNMLEFAADVEDAECVFQRLKTHVAKYTAATVATICGCTEADIAAVRDAFIASSRFSSSDFGLGSATITAAGYRSACIMYAMGATQFTSGSQGVRTYAIIQTMMGNMGRVGGGINALRGIHNVQGSTDMGVLFDLIPAYSGNPAVNQTYEDYQNKLFGNRVLSQRAWTLMDCANAKSDVRFTAVAIGPAGNSTLVEYVDPAAASQPLTVSVAGNTITVGLATDAAGAITSTAADVKAAVDGTPAAAALVTTAFYPAPPDSDGSGIVNAKPAQALAGGATAGKSAYIAADVEWQQRGFYNMTREWFGNRDVTAPADIDKLYACWPKGNGVQHIEAFRRMCPPSGADYTYTPTAAAPRISAAVVWGQNPAVTEPNQGAVRTGLENLDLLVCVDMFANETAQCKRKIGGETYLLPSCSHVEEAGSVASSGRWIQWRDRARAPKDNSKADIELLLKFAKALNTANAFSHLKTQWATMNGVTSLYADGAGADPYTILYSKYGWDGTGSMEAVSGVDFEGNTLVGSEYVAEQVFKEMCAPLDGYVGTGAPADFVGGHQGTIWIYSGVNATQGGAYNPDQTGNVHPAAFELNADGSLSTTAINWGIANRAKSRKGDPKHAAQALQYPRYGWAWLLNRRIMYNNAELPGDVADVFVAPGYLARLWCIDGPNTLADWSWLYRAYNQLVDMPSVGVSTGKHVFPGRLPAYTEPYESPYDGTLAGKPNLANDWGRNTSLNSATGVKSSLIFDTPIGAGGAFPLVLTTIRCVEHFQGGPITRNNAWNVEMEPEPWIEINSVDALKYGIKDGDYVNVLTSRGNSTSDQATRTKADGDSAGFAKGFKARVGVGTLANQRVAPGVVAIPWHWGERGLGKGSRANDLCIDAWDANTRIPEYKACLCNIQKVTP